MTVETKRVYDGLEAGLLFRDSLRDHLARYLRIRDIDSTALNETRFPYSSLFTVSFEGTKEQEAELAEWLDTYYDLLTHAKFTLARADYQCLVARIGCERLGREVRVERRGSAAATSVRRRATPHAGSPSTLTSPAPTLAPSAWPSLLRRAVLAPS